MSAVHEEFRQWCLREKHPRGETSGRCYFCMPYPAVATDAPSPHYWKAKRWHLQYRKEGIFHKIVLLGAMCDAAENQQLTRDLAGTTIRYGGDYDGHKALPENKAYRKLFHGFANDYRGRDADSVFVQHGRGNISQLECVNSMIADVVDRLTALVQLLCSDDDSVDPARFEGNLVFALFQAQECRDWWTTVQARLRAAANAIDGIYSVEQQALGRYNILLGFALRNSPGNGAGLNAFIADCKGKGDIYSVCIILILFFFTDQPTPITYNANIPVEVDDAFADLLGELDDASTGDSSSSSRSVVSQSAEAARHTLEERLEFLEKRVVELEDIILYLTKKGGIIPFPEYQQLQSTKEFQDVSASSGNDRAYWAAIQPTYLPKDFPPGSLLGLYADGVGKPSKDALAIGVCATAPDTLGPRNFNTRRQKKQFVMFVYVGLADVLLGEDLVQSILKKGEDVFLCCRDGVVGVWNPELASNDVWVFGFSQIEHRRNSERKGEDKHLDRLPTMISHQCESNWTRTQLARLPVIVTTLEKHTSNFRLVYTLLAGLCALLLVFIIKFWYYPSDVSRMVVPFGGRHIEESNQIGKVYVDQHPQLRKALTEALVAPWTGDTSGARCVSLYGCGGTGKTQMATRIIHNSSVENVYPGGVFDILCPIEGDDVSFLNYAAARLLPNRTFSQKQDLSASELKDLLRLEVRSLRPILIIANNAFDPRHISLLHSILRGTDALFVTTRLKDISWSCVDFNISVLDRDGSTGFLKNFVGEHNFQSFNNNTYLLEKADGLALGLSIIGKLNIIGYQTWNQIESRYRKLDNGNIFFSGDENPDTYKYYQGRDDSIFAVVAVTLDFFESIGRVDRVGKFEAMSLLLSGATPVRTLEYLWGENYLSYLRDFVAYSLVIYHGEDTAHMSEGGSVVLHDHIKSYLQFRINTPHGGTAILNASRDFFFLGLFSPSHLAKRYNAGDSTLRHDLVSYTITLLNEKDREQMLSGFLHKDFIGEAAMKYVEHHLNDDDLVSDILARELYFVQCSFLLMSPIGVVYDSKNSLFVRLLQNMTKSLTHINDCVFAGALYSCSHLADYYDDSVGTIDISIVSKGNFLGYYQLYMLQQSLIIKIRNPQARYKIPFMETLHNRLRVLITGERMSTRLLMSLFQLTGEAEERLLSFTSSALVANLKILGDKNSMLAPSLPASIWKNSPVLKDSELGFLLCMMGWKFLDDGNLVVAQQLSTLLFGGNYFNAMVSTKKANPVILSLLLAYGLLLTQKCLRQSFAGQLNEGESILNQLRPMQNHHCREPLQQVDESRYYALYMYTEAEVLNHHECILSINVRTISTEDIKNCRPEWYRNARLMKVAHV